MTMFGSNPLGEFGQHCLQAFTRLVPVSRGAFYRIDEQLQACDFQLQGMHPHMHAAYLEHYRDLDPLRPGTCIDTGLPVVPLREGLARQDEVRNRQYQMFLQRHRVIDVVEVIAHADGRPVAGLSLLRGADLAPFSAQELSILEPLQELMQLAARTCVPHGTAKLAQLTPRERQIALLLRDGASNKQLARHLEVGLPTVKTHLLNLFRKAGVSNRTELVAALFL